MSSVYSGLTSSSQQVLAYVSDSLVPYTEKDIWSLKLARRFRSLTFPFGARPSHIKTLLKFSRGGDPLPRLIESICGFSPKRLRGFLPYLEWALSVLHIQNRIVTSFSIQSLSFFTRSLEKATKSKNLSLLDLLLKYLPSNYAPMDSAYLSFRVLFRLHKEISYGELSQISLSLKVLEKLTRDELKSSGTSLEKNLVLLASLVIPLLSSEDAAKIKDFLGSWEETL